MRFWVQISAQRLNILTEVYYDFPCCDCRKWPQFIHHTSGTHKTQSMRGTENWFALLERTRSSIYLNVGAICSSQNVQMVLNFTPCVFQHLGCQRNYILHLYTKFDHIINIWMEYLVLYIAPKEKKNSVMLHWGSEGAKGLVHPAQSICWQKFFSDTFSL